ncbi:unnamed protein product [Schistocephalus solidus]|uniref:Uncharacterized protein n=1 Tax=Schistocephalus solidus TaxID=70667 RepID=A0A183SJZ5_SCHSO|nr:unnamed protein product [Schistocephalus solidus]
MHYENQCEGCLKDLQNQSVFRSPAGLHVESARYSPEHQTEDVKDRRFDDTPLRSGDLECLLKSRKEAESLPSQLPPQNTKAELAKQDPGHGSPGVDRNLQRSRHAEASATAMEQPSCDNGRRATSQMTLKKSLKQLQINPGTWKDLSQDTPAWRRSVKTGAAIYEANRITAAKAKRTAHKSQAPRINNANANVSTLSTHIPRANRPGQTSSNSVQQQSHNMKLCQIRLRPDDNDHPND